MRIIDSLDGCAGRVRGFCRVAGKLFQELGEIPQFRFVEHALDLVADGRARIGRHHHHADLQQLALDISAVRFRGVLAGGPVLGNEADALRIDEAALGHFVGEQSHRIVEAELDAVAQFAVAHFYAHGAAENLGHAGIIVAVGNDRVSAEVFHVAPRLGINHLVIAVHAGVAADEIHLG